MLISQQASALVQARLICLYGHPKASRCRESNLHLLFWMPVPLNGSIASKRRRMDRYTMVQTVGQQYLTSNIENGEFSYAQVIDRTLSGHYKLDIRFYDQNKKIAVLIETKNRFRKSDEDQLFDYVALEKEYAVADKIIAILANTANDKIKVWKCKPDEEAELLNDTILKSFDEYDDYFRQHNVNDRTTVLENTSILNRKLHDNGIPENLRSQFVGTCLLALKNGLVYSRQLTTPQIIAGIKVILGSLLNNSMDRAGKLNVLQEKVLENQHVREIEPHNFQDLLNFIKEKILPYINDASNEGQDILSYFFTTFNKYVAREDKNQAFTPNHIAHFMAKIAGIYKNSQVIDPTCGSGTFLVQAMTMALSKCQTDGERDSVKKKQIFGVEYDENVYGLATTNMLIHGDGNSNVKRASCFTEKNWIKQSLDSDMPVVILMNPPYNASKSQVPRDYAALWGGASTDPSKGLYFVKEIANCIKRGRLVTLLPMACAISTRGIIGDIKNEMLEKHTLDAVFSFPSEMFYPGASAVACCMVFDLGKPHATDKKTFFGYYKEDGFRKRKGIGRVDVDNKWSSIESEWLELYEHRSNKAGLSITQKISAEKEWCAEAYLETDYSSLNGSDFVRKLREYAAFLVQFMPENHWKSVWVGNYDIKPLTDVALHLCDREWHWFPYDDLFTITGTTTTPKDFLEKSGNGLYPYVTTQAVNNGVESFYDLWTEEGGVLTVDSAVLGYCSYQAMRFSASDHVEKLIPRFSMNKYIAMFLVALINKEQYRYSYGRKCSQTKLHSSKIKLPVIPGTNNPDWKFMEDYIKSLPYSKNI